MSLLYVQFVAVNMPPPNPRSLKFKGIIKAMNTQNNPKKTEKENIPQLTMHEEPSRQLRTQSVPNISCNNQLPKFQTKFETSSPFNEKNTNEEIQTFRNRKSSCSSCDSHNSNKDFSPASDDDREYKPVSNESSSSSETDTDRRSNHRQVIPKEASNSKRSSNISRSPSASRSSSRYGTSSSSGSSSSSRSSSSSKSSSNIDTGDENIFESAHFSRNNSDVTPTEGECGNTSNFLSKEKSNIQSAKSELAPYTVSHLKTSVFGSGDDTFSKQQPSKRENIKHFVTHQQKNISALTQLALEYPSSPSEENDLCLENQALLQRFYKSPSPAANVYNSCYTNSVCSHDDNFKSNAHTLNSTLTLIHETLCLNQELPDLGPMIDIEMAGDSVTFLTNDSPAPSPEMDETSELKIPLPLKLLALRCLNKENELSCDGSNNNTELSQRLTRKRSRRGSRKVLAKKLRNMGLKYTSPMTNALVSERKMGNPCADRCRLKCNERISQEKRKTVFKDYWNTGSLALQRAFIAKHITEIKPKYQYKRIDSNRKNKHAFYLTIDRQKYRVCKIFFTNTLGINDRPIRTVIEKMNNSGIVDAELRGKQKRHGNISVDLLNGVRNHIKSIPRIESHYIRKQSSREFIEGGKNVTDLYRDYQEECAKKGISFVKLHKYRQIFNEEFNISFHSPKKDQCEDCVAYQNAENPEKEKLENFYKIHLQEKDKSREEKTKDKENIDKNNIVACYDLQAMLQVPKGDVSSFYYKSRLNCLNFTVCELKTDFTKCFFWNEVEAQKGANEIGTCVFKYLQEKSASTSENLKIIFYSDNCCGQQKNQFVFSMYIYAIKNLSNIESITHKFLIKGHTQNEGDAVHSTIEKQIKKVLKSGPIYVPDQYINAIRQAKKKGQKYDVKEMCHSEFLDIKSLQEFKMTRNIEGTVVKTTEIKIFKVIKAEGPNSVKVFYKSSYLQDNYKEIKLQKIGRTRPQLKKLYLTKLPLPERKKEDLRSLIRKNTIPPYYASSFYNNIL